MMFAYPPTIPASTNFRDITTASLKITHDLYVSGDIIFIGDLNLTGDLTATSLSDGISILTNGRLSNLLDPISNQDAATKSYVDTNGTPTGGTTNQVLAKIDNTNHNVHWTSTIIPSGGLTDYILAKNSNTDYDISWKNLSVVTQGLPTGGTTGSFLFKLSNTDFDAVWTDLDYYVNNVNGITLNQTISLNDATVNLNETNIVVTPLVDFTPNSIFRDNINFTLNSGFSYWDIYNLNQVINLRDNFNNFIGINNYSVLDSGNTCLSITGINDVCNFNGSLTGTKNGINITDQYTSSSSLLINSNTIAYNHNLSLDLGSTIQTNVNITSYNSNIQFNSTDSINLYNGSAIYIDGTNCPDFLNGFTLTSNCSDTITSVQGISMNINTSTENFIGINMSTTDVTGNYTGVNITTPYPAGMPELDNFKGIYMNPKIDDVLNADGLFVDMSNVTAHVGSPSALIFQDLTYTTVFNTGPNSGIFIEYTYGGSVIISIINNYPNSGNTTISVQIVNGVTDALDIKTAVENNPTAAGAVTIIVSGTGTNVQVSDGPDELIGGSNNGNIHAAQFNGNVNINGGLSFNGALSIGQLNSFYGTTLINGTPFVPLSLDSLITAIQAEANTAYTNADILGVNTACLMTFGDNSTVTTSLTGLAALGLPAVVSTGAGSTVDQICGALFAVSMDSGSTGGTIDNLSLCKSVGIPNGITTTNNLRAFDFSLPFGSVATNQWGIYMLPDCNNFIQGSLSIGGTPGIDDTISDSSIGLEINDKHISSKQTTSPIISVGGSLSNATDIGGLISFTSNGATGIQTTITFNLAYNLLPIVQLTPRNSVAGINAIGYYVTSSVTNFTIEAANVAGVDSYEYYYTIIECK